MTLSSAAALELLWSVRRPTEIWQVHCLRVAQAARRLAHGLVENGVAVDEDFVVASALLHDIGRHIAHGLYHGWLGFRFLERRGQPELARGCVTHWLRGRSQSELLENPDLLPSFVRRMFQILPDLAELTLADKILSASDFFAAHDHLVDFTSRRADLRARYGPVPFIDRSTELASHHLTELEHLAGRPLAPDVLAADAIDPRVEHGVPCT